MAEDREEGAVPNNDVNVILIDEYKSLWHYYICQINVLAGFRDLYMKIFLVPSGIISAAALTFSKSLSDNIEVSVDIVFLSISVLLSIAFLMGMALFISYYKELGNMGNYEQAMIDIRKYFRNKNDLESVLTVDKYRREAPIAVFGKKNKTKRILSFYRSLLFSLGAIFIIGNSFFVIAITFFLAKTNLWIVTNFSLSSIFLFSLVLGGFNFLILSIWSYRLYYFYTGAAAAELPAGTPHATNNSN